jgi:hypothetical protein
MQPRSFSTILRTIFGKTYACLFALILFTLATSHHSGAAFAQDLDDVTISGRVLDQNGAGVAGARVSVVLAATNFTRAVVADGEGRYRLVELASGTYTVRAASDNFATEERAGVETLAGQTVQLDFTLRPAGVSAEQVVLSEADGGAAIDTTRTIVGGTLTRAELETLPSPTRSPLDFIFTLGGVSEEPLSTRDVAEDRNRTPARTPEEAGTFALSGGAAYSNNITIDGLDNNDDRAARERFQPSLEAVAEVQVITNQFSAEYGRASGGRINLRTRGGARDFHGRAFYFFRDEALNANSSFNNARGLKRLPLQEHTPGFTLSGQLKSPVKLFGTRDKASAQEDENVVSTDGQVVSKESTESREESPARHFFFVAVESQVVLDSTVIDTLVPVRANPRFPLPAPTTLAGQRTEAAPVAPYQPAELAPYVEQTATPLRASNFTARTDHNFSDAHNASFLYQRGRSRNLRQFGGGLRLADALQGRTRHSDALSFTDNFVPSPRLVNQLRAQISRLTPALRTDGALKARPVVLITIDDPLAADETANRSGTLVAGSSNAGASDRRETRVQLQNTLTILRGAHTFKFGGDLQRIRSTFIDLSDASGTFDFASAGEFLAGAPSRFRQRFNSESVQKNLYTGFFAQAEWHARPNLTVSYGLRYENETILKDRNNFAPRLAVAYDPFRTGKTVIRLGAGLFFNRVLLRTVDDFTLGKERVFFDTDTLRNAQTGKLLTDAERRAFIAANLSFPETLTIDSPIVKQFGALQTNF